MNWAAEVLCCYVAKVQVCSMQWLAAHCHWNNICYTPWGQLSNSCPYLRSNDQHFNNSGMCLSHFGFGI